MGVCVLYVFERERIRESEDVCAGVYECVCMLRERAREGGKNSPF